jgi:excisionase family DNA binding protein
MVPTKGGMPRDWLSLDDVRGFPAWGVEAPDADLFDVALVEEAADVLRLGRTRTYELVMAKKIQCVKVGHRRLWSEAASSTSSRRSSRNKSARNHRPVASGSWETMTGLRAYGVTSPLHPDGTDIGLNSAKKKQPSRTGAAT